MKVHFRIGTTINACAVFAACGLTWLPASAAPASECADMVSDFLMRAPAQLLSVNAKRDRCLVTYLMHREGKRPVRVTRELRAGKVDVIQAEKRSGPAQIFDHAKAR